MSENLQNERELIKARRKIVSRYFEEEITDENIRQYIFGKEGYSVNAVRSSTSDYVKYIKNILSLAFYFSYACYRRDIDDSSSDADNLTKHNAKRIINSLQNAFVKFPVTQDLIQFVLTDIQFELAQGDFSELRGVFGRLSRYSMNDFSFNPYFKLIAEYNKNPSRFMFSKIELLKMFIELIKMLTFMGDYRLECYDTDIFAFVLKNGDSEDEKYAEMYVDHIFFRDDERYFGGIYHLFSIERGEVYFSDVGNTDDGIRLKYFTPDGERALVFAVPGETDKAPHLVGQRPREIFNEITCRDWNHSSGKESYKKISNSIDQVHAVNYKYIKNLALAISDAISSNEGTKKLIFDRFNTLYPYIFERQAETGKTGSRNQTVPYDDETLNWDTVVIMLLIEASPSVVLEYVIRKVPETFYHIVKNLYKRIYDVENLSIFNASRAKIKESVRKIIDEKLIVGESAGFGRIPTERTYDKLFSRAAAMFIISKLTILQENDSDENLIYTGNLRSNISLLQKAREEIDAKKGVRYACIILGETLKHIMCFYSGLFAYGKLKKNYDIETYDRCFSKVEVLKNQKNLERAFISAAKNEAEALQKYHAVGPESAIALIRKFVDFCENCNPSNNTTTLQSKYLYAAIGKYEIINMDVLKEEYFMDLLRIDKDDDDADAWIDATLRILEYLKTGSAPDTPIDSDLFNAIYPFTAVFNRGRENTDGYRTVNFSLNIDIDDDNCPEHQMNINVLSEFSYNRSEVYYCLPNVLRSNYKWWIDPILINFKEFNEIFSDAGKEDA